jgi:hypothetical protein
MQLPHQFRRNPIKPKTALRERAKRTHIGQADIVFACGFEECASPPIRVTQQRRHACFARLSQCDRVGSRGVDYRVVASRPRIELLAVANIAANMSNRQVYKIPRGTSASADSRYLMSSNEQLAGDGIADMTADS